MKSVILLLISTIVMMLPERNTGEYYTRVHTGPWVNLPYTTTARRTRNEDYFELSRRRLVPLQTRGPLPPTLDPIQRFLLMSSVPFHHPDYRPRHVFGYSAVDQMSPGVVAGIVVASFLGATTVATAVFSYYSFSVRSGMPLLNLSFGMSKKEKYSYENKTQVV